MNDNEHLEQSDWQYLYDDIRFDEQKYLDMFRGSFSYRKWSETEIAKLSPRDFYRASAEVQQTLLRWIAGHVFAGAPRNAKLKCLTEIRDAMEFDTGLYTSKSMFRGAMIHAGFVPKNLYEIEWVFAKLRIEAARDAALKEWRLPMRAGA